MVGGVSLRFGLKWQMEDDGIDTLLNMGTGYLKLSCIMISCPFIVVQVVVITNSYREVDFRAGLSRYQSAEIYG